jgi:hypothetical protein
MEISDVEIGRSNIQSPSTLVRIGRISIVALALVLAGSTAYAAFAWRDGEARHSVSKDDPRVRTTYVGFASWEGIIPAPQQSEYTYREIQLPSGEWVKHGRYGRITRNCMLVEKGSYDHGRRDGRWIFCDSHGGFDVERSGFYANDVRVEPGPTGPADPAWIAALREE